MCTAKSTQHQGDLTLHTHSRPPPLKAQHTLSTSTAARGLVRALASATPTSRTLKILEMNRPSDQNNEHVSSKNKTARSLTNRASRTQTHLWPLATHSQHRSSSLGLHEKGPKGTSCSRPGWSLSSLWEAPLPSKSKREGSRSRRALHARTTLLLVHRSCLFRASRPTLCKYSYHVVCRTTPPAAHHPPLPPYSNNTTRHPVAYMYIAPADPALPFATASPAHTTCAHTPLLHIHFALLHATYYAEVL